MSRLSLLDLKLNNSLNPTAVAAAWLLGITSSFTQMLAILIIKPKALTANELDDMVGSVKYDRVTDWLNSCVVKSHPDNEKLRQEWMQDKNPMSARAGWNLTSQRLLRIPKWLKYRPYLTELRMRWPPQLPKHSGQ